MKEKFYPFIPYLEGIPHYKFFSLSAYREVTKWVLLTAMDESEIYNLALFDQLGDGSLSDVSETRNGDMKMILSTVMQIIDHFLTFKPNASVAFKGSDSRRHRLYRIAICRELRQIECIFKVKGFCNGKAETFVQNQNYDHYIIQKR